MMQLLPKCLFACLLLAGGLLAQIEGEYEKSGSSADIKLEIAPLPHTNCYVGAVKVNGAVVNDETMVICPDGNGGFTWGNRKGNQGTIEREANGDLVIEVTTGKKAGNRTEWEKL